MANIILTIHESYKKLTRELDSFKKAFYIRFGDIDLFMAVGRNYKSGNPLTSKVSHGNNKTVWSKELQMELRTSLKIKHRKYIKAISGTSKLERGMTDKVFGRFGHHKTFDKMASEVTDQTTFAHPWIFQYLAVFEAQLWEKFLDQYIRPKRKMFVGSTNRDSVERMIGKLDFYVKTPPKNSYSQIDKWYPEMERILTQEKEKGQHIEVIILNTGQASRVIAGRMWKNNNIGGHFLDFGSIFHAVDGIRDRWWIKEKGGNVNKRFAPKKFEHLMLTRMNYTRGNDPDYLEKRLHLFDQYAYISMRKQTNQNFKWILLFDKYTPKKYYEKYLKYKNIVILKAEGEMNEWQAHFRNWIYKNIKLDKLDYLITSRIDSDDVVHPEYMDNMQKCLFTKTHLVDSLGYQLDVKTGKYYTAKKYEKMSSPFITLVERLTPGKDPETVVKTDHPKMMKHFPLMRLHKRLFLQIVHDENLTNKINGDPVDKNINLFMIGASPFFLSRFKKAARDSNYFRNRINYLSEVFNIVEKENPEHILEIGPDDFQMFKSDTLDINEKIKDFTYNHDITKTPWPIDKKYDMVVALQVWEHLEGCQVEAFKELVKHTKKAVLSFPYMWKNSDDMHTGINEDVISQWTCGIEPVSKTIIKDINNRIICLFDFTDITLEEAPEETGQTQASISGSLSQMEIVPEKETNQIHKPINPKEVTHFVYPLSNGSSWGDNNELKNSLRSIVENFQGDFRIWIYGNKKPAWLRENNAQLLFIPVKRGPSIDYENFFDTLAKLRMACENKDIPEDFIWMYDDQYFLKSFDKSFFDSHYALALMTDDYMEELKTLYPGHGKWWRTLNIAFKLLKSKGFITYNYETHMPRLFNKTKMLYILNNCEYDNIPFAPATMYFNRQTPEIIPELLKEVDNTKVQFYAEKKASDPDWASKYDTKEFIKEQLDRCLILNHDDNGLTKNIKAAISGMFRKKSQFEK